MLYHSKQQQSVILKGIAQQILTMQMPTFEEVEKLMTQFGLHILTDKALIEKDLLANLTDTVTYHCYECEDPTGKRLVYRIPVSRNLFTETLKVIIVALESEKLHGFYTQYLEIAEAFPDGNYIEMSENVDQPL